MLTNTFVAILDVTTFPSKCKDSRRAKPSKMANSMPVRWNLESVDVINQNRH